MVKFTGTSPAGPSGRAVVIVSGGAAVSPFTTPEHAARSGLAAGNTDTALREHLLNRGHTVYTSPAMAGRGPVVDQDGFGAFADCPITLPDIMTVDSTGSIDLAGERLARFLTYLHDEYGAREIDVVGHSMGGLFSRAAFRVLQATGSPLRIRSLTTIGTPWQGGFLADYANGVTELSVCLGNEFCERNMLDTKAEVERLMTGAGREVSRRYLMGPDGWNEFQAGVLDDIPVTLIAGEGFDHPEANDTWVWPNDGLVTSRSALATDIGERVLPHRRTIVFDDTHSIYVSDLAGLPWQTALTWDPRVLDVVASVIEEPVTVS